MHDYCVIEAIKIIYHHQSKHVQAHNIVTIYCEHFSLISVNCPYILFSYHNVKLDINIFFITM